MHDLSLIMKSLDLKNDQVIFDLGAGDGIVIFAAAEKAWEKKLNTKFIAIDINPILIFILNIRRFFHPNKKNIKIIFGDFFKMGFYELTMNYELQTTFYLYISPWFLDQIIKNLKLKIKKFKVVSYMYPIKNLKKKEKIIQGENSIFVYS